MRLRAAKRSSPCSGSVAAERGRGRQAVEEGRVVAQVELGLGVEDADRRQPVTAADLEIVEVVRWGYLYRAGPLLGVRVFIGHNGDAAPNQRQDDELPDQVLVARILGMHRHRGVAQHGFGPGGGDRDPGVGQPFERVLEIPEMALHLDLLDLEVGDGGEELRVPVDQTLVLVDEAGAIKLDEDPQNGARQPLVHGEALARPVAGCTEPLELADDGAAGLRLPGPHPLQELLAPHGAAARLLPLHQLALDHHLGGDAGMVHAGLPQHVAAAHALEAAEHVLQGVVERVAHMQGAGHVGRRDHDAVRLRLGPVGVAGTEGLGILPGGVDAPFELRRLVGLFDHCGFACGAWRARGMRSEACDLEHAPVHWNRSVRKIFAFSPIPPRGGVPPRRKTDQSALLLGP